MITRRGDPDGCSPTTASLADARNCQPDRAGQFSVVAWSQADAVNLVTNSESPVILLRELVPKLRLRPQLNGGVGIHPDFRRR